MILAGIRISRLQRVNPLREFTEKTLQNLFEKI